MNTNDDKTRIDTNDGESRMNTNDDKTRIDTNDGESRMNTNDDKTRIDTNDGESRMNTNNDKTRIDTKKYADLIYPELSYKIMGILFEVHNKLGAKYQEKHYQRAIEIKLKSAGLAYQREAKVSVEFESAELGKFYIDFVIENKIILEVKTVPTIVNDVVRQVLRYLDSSGLKLGIIANFRHSPLEYRRVVL